jgi:hypothetical protein
VASRISRILKTKYNLSPMFLRRAFLPFALLPATVATTDAQETRCFMPREIAQADEEGTRAYASQPEPNYWQHTVKDDIEFTPEEERYTGIVLPTQGVRVTENKQE